MALSGISAAGRHTQQLAIPSLRGFVASFEAYDCSLQLM